MNAKAVAHTCPECEKPIEDILDTFFWDGKLYHMTCGRAKAHRCLHPERKAS